MPTISGGTVTTIGGDTLCTFNSSGNLVVSGGTVTVWVLIVAGGGSPGNGGGGSGGSGGGGGGGDVLEWLAMVLPAGTYPYVHGVGGRVSSGATQNGGNGTFNGYTVYGGGAGGSTDNSGNAGGSAGGSGPSNSFCAGTAAGSGTNVNSGGANYPGNPYSSGGGAGAGGPGVDATSSNSGNGGPGYLSNIIGTAVYYGPGGGGNNYGHTDTSLGGGPDGGGKGGNSSTATSGTDGIGGGAGGGEQGNYPTAPRGGDGALYVRYSPFAPTTTTLTSGTPSTFNYGSGGSYTATISSSGSPTGTVTFYDATSISIGATTVSSGVATFLGITDPTQFLAVGVHTITAVYSGDGTFASSSGTLVQTVAKATPTITVSSNHPTASYGTTVILQAGDGFPTPGGTVTFLDGGSSMGTGTWGSGSLTGVANFSISTLTVGTHTITATFSGDSNNNSATSSPGTQTITTITTTTGVNFTPGTIAFGTNFTFTASVTGGTPTGTIDFLEDGTSIGNGTISGGFATFNTSSLAVGTHTITASYPGDGTHASSTSTGMLLVVRYSSTTSLTLSASSATYGTDVTLTATPTSSGTPTGSVVFLDGASTVGSGTISGGSVVATYSLPAVGTHSLTAVYAGDVSNLGSTSGVSTLTVGKVTSTTAIAATPSTANYGTPVTFSATVTGTSPTGTVIFKDGGVSIGNGTSISAGLWKFSTSTLAGASIHTLTAAYSGDVINTGSTSGTVTVEIDTIGSTTTIASSGNPVAVGIAVTFSLAVTGAGTTPTGTIVWNDNGTSIGSGTLDGSGHLTFNTSALTAGAHTITGVYSGDVQYSASTGTLIQNIGIGGRVINNPILQGTIFSSPIIHGRR